jgi:hypothetical protein
VDDPGLAPENVGRRGRGYLSGRLRLVGFVVGLALLAAAIAVVWMRRDTVADALAAVDTVRPAHVALLLGAVVANVVLSAFFLHALIRRYGHVGRLEMQALVAATTLLNYLPLRPGLFGRMAYHRTVNGIPVVDTAKTIVQSAVITTAIAGYVAVASLITVRLEISLWTGVLVPPVLIALACIPPVSRSWAIPVALRYAEILVWALRYHAAFLVLGSPISPTVALAFACASVIASMVPFVSNGLGLREWAIGLLAPVLTAYPMELGMTADLVNRAGELVVVGVLGATGIALLAKGTVRSRAARPEPE